MEVTAEQIAEWDAAIAAHPKLPALVVKLSRNTLRAGTWMRSELLERGLSEGQADLFVTGWCTKRFMARRPLEKLLDEAVEYVAQLTPETTP